VNDDEPQAPRPASVPPPPPWPLPPPVRRSKSAWILGVVGSILIVASIVASFVRLPYYTIAPGDALDVNGLVTVHGARKYPPKGSVMLLFVRERSRINAWRWLQASLDSDIDLIKEQQFAGNADPADLDAQAVADMTESQTAAKIVALRRLGYKVEPEKRIRVDAVIRNRPAATALKAGDLIVSLDGKTVSTPEQLTDRLAKHRPGDQISIGYVRAGGRHTASICVAAGEKGRPVIGVYLGVPYKFPVDVDVDTRDIGGPSAGLAMTLSILDELTPGNLTGGKQIAVTGEILPDGTVNPIGGAGQKAVAARHRGAQLFIVPKLDVAAAKTRAGSMPVVGVDNLDDALRALRKIGGAALPASVSSAAA
jgi:PDZ domain-containing secreted protein